MRASTKTPLMRWVVGPYFLLLFFNNNCRWIISDLRCRVGPTNLYWTGAPPAEVLNEFHWTRGDQNGSSGAFARSMVRHGPSIARRLDKLPRNGNFRSNSLARLRPNQLVEGGGGEDLLESKRNIPTADLSPHVPCHSVLFCCCVKRMQFNLQNGSEVYRMLCPVKVLTSCLSLIRFQLHHPCTLKLTYLYIL